MNHGFVFVRSDVLCLQGVYKLNERVLFLNSIRCDDCGTIIRKGQLYYSGKIAMRHLRFKEMLDVKLCWSCGV